MRGNSKFRRYGGGHLIGTRLGGVSERYNLVPQDASFNSNIYRQVEVQAAKCDVEDGVFMRVDAVYPDDMTLVPERFLVKMWMPKKGFGKQVTFFNSSGASRSEEVIRADFLTDLLKQECGG